jgi:hypothetical protein
MTLKLHLPAVLALGLVGSALSAGQAVAHPQFGYGHGYHSPRGRGEVVIIQPPVRYAPPPVYYAPPPVYYVPPPRYHYPPPQVYYVPRPYPHYGHYGRPGVSFNFRF